MFGTGVPWANVAVDDTGWYAQSGTGGPSLATSAPTRLFPQARNRAGCKDVLVMYGGQSDIYKDGQTGAQTYTRAVNYANDARSAGFGYVLAITSPPFDPFSAGTFTAAINAYNAALIADTSNGFDAKININVPPISDPGDATYHESDRIHLKAPGALFVAGMVRPWLISFLAGL